MRPRPYPLSPAYLAYARGLRELHRLELAGQSNSPEADEVRDAMDLPWRGLGEAESARLDGLSEDLYTISDPPHEPEPMTPQAQSKLNEFSEAFRRGEWDRALALLRRWAKYISPARLAFLRGTVWRWAGDPESASLFLERAHQLDPDEPDYTVAFLLNADPSQAKPVIDQILRNPQARSLREVVLSVGVVLQSRSDLPTHEYQRFADILQAALAKADEDPRQTDILQAVLAKADEDPRQRESVYRVSGFRYLGLCRECTGANRAAAEAYTQGLAIDPDDASLLAARGLVGYGSDPGAIRDLERSVAQSVDFIAPYLYLAHHRFREQRFKDCLQLCDAALRFDGPETIKSELMEWTAIARAELEFPADMVREAFEEAVRLDPSNERALHNRALYEERLASPREEEPGRFEARTPRELRASVPPGFWFRGAA